MITIGNESLTEVLDLPSLLARIEDAFRDSTSVPARHVHTVHVPQSSAATWLLMPSWQSGRYLGLKSATIFPSNGAIGLPSVAATFFLLDGMTGRPLAVMDGRNLTVLRTAATSALASRMLSRQNSKTLLMVGAGELARPLIKAHAAVRPIETVLIFNRTSEKAVALADVLAAESFTVEAVTELETAARGADIISCATLSTEALILGDWIKEGTHIDLVGAFTPQMRESDSRLIERSDVYVDTYDGARAEAGDLVQAEASGVWKFERIFADLGDLVSNRKPGRTSDESITIFKSVGCALEDLAAATLAYERMAKPDGPVTQT